ncbi:hypothetical protein ACWEQ3_49225 [Streptomyces mirabilis]
MQPVPEPACAIPPQRGITEERGWLRRNLCEQFNPIAGSVSRMISESPGCTDLLEPAVPDRVLFLSCASFKVLSIRTGDRYTVLLRELSSSEIAEDGRVDDQRVPLNEIALAGLKQTATACEELTVEAHAAPPQYAAVLGNPPGLITTAAVPRPQNTAGAATPREGTKP